MFDGIPGQLSKHEKKFILSSLGKGARMREYEDAFFWLSDARITNGCFNSTDSSVGLGMSEDRTLVKCYMADTGLLVSHAFADRDATSDGGYRDDLIYRPSAAPGPASRTVSQLDLSDLRNEALLKPERPRDGRRTLLL